MHSKRLWHTLRCYTILSSQKRTEYLRKKGVFASIGKNCSIMNRTVPLYANLIKLGNNVRLASKVTFITHDVTHVMLNHNPNVSKKGFKEKIGCIEIQDNVFVGAGSTILYGVLIGSNVIIGAGSLVNKDVPPNSVVAGVPARVIGSFDDYLSKRAGENSYPDELSPSGEQLSDAAAKWCWKEFYKAHGKH